MLLGFYGHEVPEPYLRELCDCHEEGTSAPQIVRVAIEYFNLQGSVSANLNIDGLRDSLQGGLWPIVYFSSSDLDLMNFHAAVVIEIKEKEIDLLDPALDVPGEAVFDLEDFERRWARARGRTILISN